MYRQFPTRKAPPANPRYHCGFCKQEPGLYPETNGYPPFPSKDTLLQHIVTEHPWVKIHKKVS